MLDLVREDEISYPAGLTRYFQLIWRVSQTKIFLTLQPWHSSQNKDITFSESTMSIICSFRYFWNKRQVCSQAFLMILTSDSSLGAMMIAKRLLRSTLKAQKAKNGMQLGCIGYWSYFIETFRFHGCIPELQKLSFWLISWEFPHNFALNKIHWVPNYI